MDFIWDFMYMSTCYLIWLNMMTYLIWNFPLDVGIWYSQKCTTNKTYESIITDTTMYIERNLRSSAYKWSSHVHHNIYECYLKQLYFILLIVSVYYSE